MVSNLRGRAAVAGTTFLVWALVAASVAFWALRFAAGPTAPPPPVPARATAPIDPSTVARLLGSSPAQSTPVASAASRFALLGVVATAEHEGAALIAVDGKPPRPYRVGASVDENLVLKTVDPRQATLGPAQGAPTITLAMPQRATGTGGPAGPAGAPQADAAPR